MEISKMNCSILLVTFSLLICHSVSYTFYAGGKDGWVLHPSESYSTWASRNRFQINDTIVFKYKQGEDSVLLVNQNDYDQCNLNNPIQKMENGDSVFTFDRSGPFYFVSGTADRCKQGEKLTVVVLAVRSSVPVSPTPSSSPVTPPISSPVAPPKISPVPSSSSPVAPPKISPVPSSSPVTPPKISPVPSSSPVAPPKNSPVSSPVAPPVSSPVPSSSSSPVAPPKSSPVSPPKSSPVPSSFSPVEPPKSSPVSSPVAQGPSGESSPASLPNQNGASEIRVSAIVMGVAVVIFNFCFFN